MSTSAQVRAAWSALFATFAEPNLTHELPRDLTDTELHGLYPANSNRLDFWTFVVVRNRVILPVHAFRYTFRVTVRRFKESTELPSAHQDVLTGLETLEAAVFSTLGETWSGTVDFYTPPAEVPEATIVPLAGKQVWRATQIWQAEKVTTV